MEQKIFLNFPRRTFVYISAGLAVLVVFLYGGILPSRKALAGAEMRLSEIKALIAEKEALLPIYKSLNKKAARKESLALPLPPAATLPREQIERVSLTIREMGKMHNIEVVSVKLDMNSMTAESKLLPVSATARGNFFDFRKFMIGLGGLPYLTTIEEFTLQQTPEEMECKITVWLALH